MFLLLRATSKNSSSWKELQEIYSPTCCPNQDQLWDQAFQGFIQLGLENVENGDGTTSLGTCSMKLENISPCLNLFGFSSCPVAKHCCEVINCISLITSFQILGGLLYTVELSLLQLEHTKLPQFLYVFQLLTLVVTIPLAHSNFFPMLWGMCVVKSGHYPRCVVMTAK